MESIVSPDGTRIGYARSGSGPPLLLVHGTSADHTRWPHILPPLEQHFTVYAMDRRGRGSSGDSDDYNIAREFEDIATLVDTIADTSGAKVDVFGHSFGALCTLEAAQLTNNIARMLLYEPPPPGEPENFPPAIKARLEELLKSGDRDGVVATFLGEVAMLSDAELAQARAAPSWPGRVAAAHTIIRENVAEGEMPPFDPARFQNLQIPTLLLLGGDSPTMFRRMTDMIHAALPNSTIEILPGQKHVAMNTAPDLFLGALFNFLGVAQ